MDKWTLKNIKSGEILDISKSLFKIGRHAQADLTSLNGSLSRNHATLSILIDGCLYVQDNKSCNGTFVNKQKIPPMEMKLLKHGDIIGFGCFQKMCTDENIDTTLLIFEVLKNNDVLEIKDSSSNSDIEIQEPNTTVEPCKSVQFSRDISEMKDFASNNDILEIKEPTKVEFKSEQDHEIKTHSNVGYSTECNDCIIISDGEDDDHPFSSSQIFKLSEKIKTEQTSLNESVDPYAHIKQELEDLDSCDNIQNVDLTSDQDRFDSTNELINILESPNNIINPNTEGECSSSISPRPKFTKPPIVEPHIFTKVGRKLNIDRSKRKNNPAVKNAASPKKSISKRKNTNTNPKSSKKIKTGCNLTESSCDKKSINDEFKKRNKAKNTALHKKEVDKESKKIILIERKRKLKEISDKDNSKSCHEPIAKTNISTSKVKCSNGRGDFLLGNAILPTITNSLDTAPSTSKYLLNTDIKVNQNSVSQSKKNNEKCLNLRKNPEEEKIQDTTISSNFSPKSDANILVSTKVSISKAVSTIQRPDSTSNEDRSGFIWQTVSNSPRPLINNIHRNITNIDDEICKIVHWSVKWLMEQNNCDISPPVNGDRQPVKMPLSISSFSEYYNIAVPLITLELWQYIYQTLYNKDEERAPVRAYLNHKRIIGKLTYLDCECYISEENIKNNVFRTDDFALIELKLKDTANDYICTRFAHIKFCKRTNFKDDLLINTEIAELCPGIPYANLKFSLVTRNLPDMDVIGTQIIVKVIANIGSSLRLFKTVKFLEISPLLKQILSPNIEDYKLSTQDENLIVEVHLNNQQKKIVLEACDLCLRDGPGIYLIKGPPGTGKSTVIINIVLQIVFSSINKGRKPLILLTAPSNAAVDGLILKLAETRLKLSESQKRSLKLVRIGPDSSISKSVDKFKLSSLARNHILKDKNLTSLEEYKNALERGDDLEQFLRAHLGYNYFYEMKCAEDILLFGSNIICTTLNSCVSSRIMDSVRRDQLKFSCCIIDESTQCCEAESLLPIQLGVDKFVLVGDPQQLPAVVCNKEAQKLGYGKSLFSRIDENFKERKDSPIKMLFEQYRMKPEICEYPNKTFYGGKLKSLPIHINKIIPELKPYLLFNLINSEYNDSSAYKNSEEVQLIYNLLVTLRKHILGKCSYTIGIITPYRAQKGLLIRHVSDIRFNPNVSITVNTVDSFQGMENDVIIISCVRYTPNYFLQNAQRLNVALTRAKQALYVIGNYTLFKHCRPLYDLREDAKKRRLCIDLNLNQINSTDLCKYILR